MLQEYSMPTKLSYEQTINVLEEKLAEIKFGVLCKLDLPEKFKEKGLTYKGKFTIFEICNPALAINALEINPRVVYFLPCKIVVSEKDGMGVLGMIKPSSMISELKDKDLNAFAGQIEEELIGIMESISCC